MIEYVKTDRNEDWRKLRHKSIGGSDAATIVGLNNYATPYSLWVEKTGDLPEERTNEAMREGHDFEDYVASRFCEETGKEVERLDATIKNDAYPFAHANIDRKIVGENAGLECKTTSRLNWNKYEDGEFPDNYYVQCLHYMAVGGFDKYYLAVLVFQEGLHVFEIERDEEVIGDLMKAEGDFWKMVEDKTPPDVDGEKATGEALLSVFRDSNPDKRISLAGMEDRIERLAVVKERIKSYTAEKDRIEQEIKSEMGEAETAEGGGYRFTWKPQSRKRFDAKKCADEHPEIDFDRYYSVTESRVFRSRKLKREDR